MSLLSRLHRAATVFDFPLRRWGGSVLNLAVRYFVGWQFFKSGWLKISDWGNTLALFQYEHQVPLLPPMIAAILGTFGELFFPILLFIGLFCRPAALGLFIVNAVAVIAYSQLWELECPAAINDHFYWGVLLLFILCWGSGRFAVDPWLSKRI